MENKKQSIELAEILSSHEETFKKSHLLCPEQLKAYNAIKLCRTSALGGHIEYCNSCTHKRQAYNSCRNRHCPKCQFIKKEQWVDKLAGNLPPVRHFHVVFTIPHILNKLFYLNQGKAYNVFFKAASKSLAQVAANPHFLGAQIGAVAILHTWGQNLSYHPHIHAIVPAGGLSDDLMEWIPAGKKFFLPVKVLSGVFRGILCRLLHEGILKGDITLPDDTPCFEKIKKECYSKNWVVYCEKPFHMAKNLINYLGNYTHRIALSNNRLISHEQNKVAFFAKDYAKAGIKKRIKLDTHEFIRRFMQHVLPSGFYKIRYWGFMAMCNMATKLKQCYDLIPKASYLPLLEGLSALEVWRELTGMDPVYCPKCKKGKMIASKGILLAKSEYG